MGDRTKKARSDDAANWEISPNGYFRIAKSDGVFWLADPAGNRFLSKGVNTVRYDQDAIRNSSRAPYAEACRHKYGTIERWRATVADRLAGWGFNTLGAWSDEAVATAGSAILGVTPNLDLGMSYTWDAKVSAANIPRQEFPDVFDPNFEDHIRRRAQALCAPRTRERHIIGWFIDNELRWGPDWRGPDELLMLFINLPTTLPGRHAALAWLRHRHGDFEQFNSIFRTPCRSWDELAALAHVEPPYCRKPSYQRTMSEESYANHVDPRRAAFAADCNAFAALIAERYFALTSSAIRAVDPNHLVLGSRFAYAPACDIVDAAARHADVISFNCYDTDPSAAIRACAASGKPCLIGEFSFRGCDSGLPNTNGAGPIVPTQADRAAGFRRYVTAALRHPSIIGYHWFEHADQPAEGRFDGENSNFGTVTINDDIYDELTRTITSVNAEADAVHADAALSYVV